MALLEGEVKSSRVVYFRGDVCTCTAVRDVDVGDGPVAPLSPRQDHLSRGEAGGLGVR